LGIFPNVGRVLRVQPAMILVLGSCCNDWM